ncbi:hypothetical protein PBS_24350 [Paraburkholderia sp. 2C]
MVLARVAATAKPRRLPPATAACDCRLRLHETPAQKRAELRRTGLLRVARNFTRFGPGRRVLRAPAAGLPRLAQTFLSRLVTRPHGYYTHAAFANGASTRLIHRLP